MDVNRRFNEHNSGSQKAAKFLKGKSPLQLVFKRKIGDRAIAMKIEIAVKRLSKAKKEMIIKRKLKISDIKMKIEQKEKNKL